jgi:ABC-2 type transport system permease protein
MMITYSLAASLLGSIQHQDAMAWQLANEVREGQFSKYLVHPVWVTGYFLGAGLGRWVYLLLVNGAVMLVWLVVFSGWLAAPLRPQSWWMLALVPLGAVCMLLFNHIIALLSLKYQDVGGMMILKGSVIEFLSGSLLPLSLLPGRLVDAMRFTPFYYVVFYPANFLLGKETEPPAVAAAILLAWCLVFLLVSEAWFRRARKFYEGVGI